MEQLHWTVANWGDEYMYYVDGNPCLLLKKEPGDNPGQTLAAFFDKVQNLVDAS